MNLNTLPHARPESVYRITINKINKQSEINPHIGFNFKDKEYNELKSEGYEDEFIVSYEIEKKPSNIIMKMYDYDQSYLSYDWIIWLLNDISNPLKELTYNKTLKKYNKKVLDRIIVKFKEVNNKKV